MKCRNCGISIPDGYAPVSLGRRHGFCGKKCHDAWAPHRVVQLEAELSRIHQVPRGRAQDRATRADLEPALAGERQMTKCRSCGAPIVWAVTPTTRRPMPMQVDPQGTWVIEAGVVRHVGPVVAEIGLGDAQPVTRFATHFATCPHASGWRCR